MVYRLDTNIVAKKHYVNQGAYT